MVKYLNLHGDSNVKCYEIHNEYIDVIFNNTPYVYRYSNIKPGANDLNNLKKLAVQGYGLNEYINRNVRKNYERRIYICQ